MVQIVLVIPGGGGRMLSIGTARGCLRGLEIHVALILGSLKQPQHAGWPSLFVTDAARAHVHAHGYTLGIITSSFQCDLVLMARYGVT
jgi:hypothetical protein